MKKPRVSEKSWRRIKNGCILFYWGLLLALMGSYVQFFMGREPFVDPKWSLAFFFGGLIPYLLTINIFEVEP